MQFDQKNDTPQLPAELEKRFDEEFAHLSVLIDQALSYTYVDSKNMGELKIKDIKHFLATALEEQKEKYVVHLRTFLTETGGNDELSIGFEAGIKAALALLTQQEEAK